MSNYLLNDHKTGFKLTSEILRYLRPHININSRTFFAFWDCYMPTDNYVVVVRDPREIIISGYFYHLKCKEKWAVHDNGYYYDFWLKNHFLESEIKKNKEAINFAKQFSSPYSYQSRLREHSLEDGIILEMNSVAKLTIDGMSNLSFLNKENVHIVKFEDLVFEHDVTIEGMCIFLGIDQKHHDGIVDKCSRHNLLKQKSNNAITTHTTNVEIARHRYRKFWSERIQNEFEKLFPYDPVLKFGYD